MHICALLYGDHLKLAERCLVSITEQLKVASFGSREWLGPVELSVGLNSTSTRVEKFVLQHLINASHGESFAKARIFWSDKNIGKYPMMRGMFQRVPGHALTMWFDDDSYFVSRDPHWFESCKRMLTSEESERAEVVMLGDVYQRAWPFSAYERAMISRQPWYGHVPFLAANPRFVTGGWWVAVTGILETLDYPFPCLHHCGGDVILGEALRQRHVAFAHWSRGVAVNADDNGQPAAATPRGMSIERQRLWEKPGYERAGPVGPIEVSLITRGEVHAEDRIVAV